MTLWCEPQAPGRAEFRSRRRHEMRRGACAPRSLSARTRSIEVGSAQCKSSKTRTSGCDSRAGERTRPPSPPIAGVAIHPARRLASVSGGTGMSTAARPAAHIPRRPDLMSCEDRFSSSASRRSRACRRTAITRAVPIRPQDAAAYSARVATNTTRPRSVASRRAARETLRPAATSPKPGSPTIRTN